MEYIGYLTIFIFVLFALVVFIDAVLCQYEQYKYLKDKNLAMRQLSDLDRWMAAENEEVSWVLTQLLKDLSSGRLDASSFREKFRERFSQPEGERAEEKIKHKGMKFVFEHGEYYPSLKTIMRDKISQPEKNLTNEKVVE